VSTSPRILIVEDELQVARALERLFRRNGMITRTASSAAEALALLEVEPPDVVLSDYRMPGMTGGELLRRVAALHPRVARILLSGYTDQELGDAGGEAHESFPKPWDDDALVAAVRRRVQDAR
jgi:DNA-binding NtrC family response regulator